MVRRIPTQPTDGSRREAQRWWLGRSSERCGRAGWVGGAVEVEAGSGRTEREEQRVWVWE